jgi:hypothetical protein
MIVLILAISLIPVVIFLIGYGTVEIILEIKDNLRR